ncbi:uncharacterized protein GVI51_J10263 [Nakaseomyces glabratus]|uniref:Ras-GAP domain-containing protein n=1 Tax=Candida glabrata (strain ATCC 2001 / BCRC 20586 / JCM 3761 / NBRC 0622 / NRRL Y-65 / CBS 138) TaxID=284593 RepID=Q6FNM9_CANGA|nr:uncharacterized protein CAGL0J10428g [Nakaseomyces glabratus]QHS67817.1 uncharacterized protein GVI51_J10263 [Nakaseomyces glabratus]CAG61116.1 unnamed protein product [Nakaseomyces glabratus]|eukprot:XP_448165.1 uncharacterized protein CAGL0J10428g [[Candida] glabrata]
MSNIEQLQAHFTSERFQVLIKKNKGCFIGKVDWCSELSIDVWKTHYLQITDQGSLTHAIETPIISKEFVGATSGFKEPKHPIIKHLQKCGVRLLSANQHSQPGGQQTYQSQPLPIIEVIARNPNATKDMKVYLRIVNLEKFQELLVSLIWWSTFNSKGIFDKVRIQHPEYLPQTEPTDRIDVLSESFEIECNVYGPIPFDANVTTLKNISNIENYLSHSSFIDAGSMLDPDYLSNSSNFSWFKAKCILKKTGILDIIIDETIIYSLDVKTLLSSEVRIVNGHLYDDNCLYIGHLSSLRSKINYVGGNLLGGVGLDDKHQALLLHSKLKHEIELMYTLFQLFTSAEQLSLIGAARSNTLRLVNNLEVSVLEGNLNDMSGIEEGTLFVDVILWGKIFARTPFVQSSKNPFWREIFEFTEAVIPDKLQFDLKYNSDYKQQILGRCTITKDMIHGTMLDKETRVPLFSVANPEKQVGTLCLKVTSRRNYILPPNNFKKIDETLNSINLKYLTGFAYGESIGTSKEVEKCAVTFLNIFQTLQKEDIWCTILINKELEDFSKQSGSRPGIDGQYMPSRVNSLFRGNSILTKTLELYFLRIGREYLEKAFGTLIRNLLNEEVSFEMDPMRISAKDDIERRQIIQHNSEDLKQWVCTIWNRIIETSNDLPKKIKKQLHELRKGFEIICLEKGQQSILNCISAFLFLRFFCPLILNPKLFKFTESHLTMKQTRNMLLITKVLQNISTLNPFGVKEQWLQPLNPFVEGFREQVIEYVDKVTERKIDFSTKLLGSTADRETAMSIIKPDVLPYMKSSVYGIDKYQDETELIELITTDKLGVQNNIKSERTSDLDKLDDWTTVDEEKPEIGELEFEEITEDNSDVFGDDLMRYLKSNESPKKKPSSKIYSMQFKEITKQDYDLFEQLETESALLVNKLDRLLDRLADYEYPSIQLTEMGSFVQSMSNKIYYTKNGVIVADVLRDGYDDDQFSRLFNEDGKTDVFLSLPTVDIQNKRDNTERSQLHLHHQMNGNGKVKSSSMYNLGKIIGTKKKMSESEEFEDEKKLNATTRFGRWLKKKI